MNAPSPSAHNPLDAASRVEERLLARWRGRPRWARIGLVAAVAVLFLGLNLLPERYGLERRMWEGLETTGEPILVTRDSALDFADHRLRADAPGARKIAIEWRGWLRVPATEPYTFTFTHDGLLTFAVDDTLLLTSQALTPDPVEGEARESLKAGVYPVVITLRDPGGATHVVGKWARGTQLPSVIGGGEVAIARDAFGSWWGHGARQGMWWAAFLLLMLLMALELAAADWDRIEALLQQRRKRRAALGAILGLGVAVRLYVLLASGFMTIADEAIVGVMGLHILEGRHFPLLFYGQFYGGALESWLMVPLFALFGASPVTLKLLPFVLSLLLIPLVYAVGRRLTNTTGALGAALFVAVPPLMPLLYSLMAMIGPVEIAVLGMLYLWMALRVVAAEKPHPREEFLLGLAAGLGIWVNAQIFYYLAAGELLLLLYRRPLLLRFWWPCWGTAGLLLGLFPLLYYSFFTQWIPFRHLGGSVGEATPAYAFFENFLGRGMTALLGGRPRWQMGADVILPPLPVLVYAVFALAVAAVLFRAIRERTPGLIFLALSVFLVPAIYLSSAYGSLLDAPPRYVYTVFPLVPLMLVALLAPVARRVRLPAILAALVIVAVNGAGIFREDPRLFFQHEADIADARLLPADNGPLLEELERRGVEAVSTDFWIGWNLSFASREGVVHDDWLDRYPPYHARFLETDRPAWVYHNNEQRGEWRIDALEELFALVDYEALDVPPYRVFVPRDRVQPRGLWEAYGSVNSGDSFLGVDGDINAASAWRSQAPQEEWQSFLIDTHESVPRNRVVFHWGPNPQDAPAGARLLVSPDAVTWSDPIPLLPTETLNGAWADLGGRTVRMLKVELTEDAPERQWAVYDVFVE